MNRNRKWIDSWQELEGSKNQTCFPGCKIRIVEMTFLSEFPGSRPMKTWILDAFGRD